MWKTDVPKINGWYWIRKINSPSEMWIDEIKDSGYWFEALDEWMVLTKQDGLEFYGPIDPPKDF